MDVCQAPGTMTTPGLDEAMMTVTVLKIGPTVSLDKLRGHGFNIWAIGLSSTLTISYVSISAAAVPVYRIADAVLVLHIKLSDMSAPRIMEKSCFENNLMQFWFIQRQRFLSLPYASRVLQRARE